MIAYKRQFYGKLYNGQFERVINKFKVKKLLCITGAIKKLEMGYFVSLRFHRFL